MSSPPRLPLHTGDYLKDTPPVSRVNWEHHGIYLLALITAWNTPKCQLPNDPQWLASRFGCTVDEYHEHVEPVLKTYFKTDGNFLRQKRLRQEHGFVLKQAKSQSDRAKTRWNKEKSACRGIAAAVPESQSGNAPTPTPTVSKKERDPPLSPPPLTAPPDGVAGRKAPANGHKQPRGSRLPPDWQPSAEDCAFAERLGLDPGAVADEFADYWRGRSGQGGVKLDWPATWRNWCRREERAPRNRQQPGGVMDAAARVIARHRRDTDF